MSIANLTAQAEIILENARKQHYFRSNQLGLKVGNQNHFDLFKGAPCCNSDNPCLFGGVKIMLLSQKVKDLTQIEDTFYLVVTLGLDELSKISKQCKIPDIMNMRDSEGNIDPVTESFMALLGANLSLQKLVELDYRQGILNFFFPLKLITADVEHIQLKYDFQTAKKYYTKFLEQNARNFPRIAYLLNMMDNFEVYLYEDRMELTTPFNADAQQLDKDFFNPRQSIKLSKNKDFIMAEPGDILEYPEEITPLTLDDVPSMPPIPDIPPDNDKRIKELKKGQGKGLETFRQFGGQMDNLEPSPLEPSPIELSLPPPLYSPSQAPPSPSQAPPSPSQAPPSPSQAPPAPNSVPKLVAYLRSVRPFRFMAENKPRIIIPYQEADLQATE